jgi:hypothetical protein
MGIGIDGRGERFEDGADAFSVFGVAIVMAWQDDGAWAKREGLVDGHAGCDAEEFGFVAGGDHSVASNHDGLAAIFWMDGLLDGGEEAVDVDVGDVGNCGRRMGLFAGVNN